MFFELIATFVAGFAAAGVVLAVNVVTRGLLPRWMTPVAAGLAMLGMAIYNEATWGPRTVAGLPDGVEVIDRTTQSAWWRPWTYVAPQTVRLIALDTRSVRENDNAPGVKLVDLYLFARWQPTAQVAQMVRCTDPARADPTDAALTDPDAANWRPVPADDDLIRLTCTE